MKTLVYRLRKTGDENAGSVIVHHIFACNLKDLQMEASELLGAIQKEVPLRRALAETGANVFSFGRLKFPDGPLLNRSIFHISYR